MDPRVTIGQPGDDLSDRVVMDDPDAPRWCDAAEHGAACVPPCPAAPSTAPRDGDHELDRALDHQDPADEPRICAGTYTGVHEPGCAALLGPATSADLLEHDAVPEPVDSAAPARTYLPGCAPVGPSAETRPIRAGRTTDDIHARTLARART